MTNTYYDFQDLAPIAEDFRGYFQWQGFDVEFIDSPEEAEALGSWVIAPWPTGSKASDLPITVVHVVVYRGEDNNSEEPDMIGYFDEFFRPQAVWITERFPHYEHTLALDKLRDKVENLRHLAES